MDSPIFSVVWKIFIRALCLAFADILLHISSKMLFGNIAPIVKVVIMVTGALILCVPFQKLIKNIVGKIKFNNQ